MKKRCTGLAVVLISFVTFGVANADFTGVIDPLTTETRIDSVDLTQPNMSFLTPGWGSHLPLDTFVFTGATSWPASVMLYGTVNGLPANTLISTPKPDTWYHIGLGVVYSQVEFFGETGVEESMSTSDNLQCLRVSPSVVTGQMTVRVQSVGTGRPVVEIRDEVGNVVRSLDCAAGPSGVATATWNRADDFGRLVPAGIYFCRYAGAAVRAVQKVLVTH